MKIAYAFYELEARHRVSAVSSALKREGALLKVQFDAAKVGYADCHPWPELGDLSLKQQLAELAQGRLTLLTRCALEFALLDAEYRLQGKNLLVEQKIPRSHFLITDLFNCAHQDVEQMIQKGYTHVKLKLGRLIDEEAELLYSLFLSNSLKIRLDFNESLTSETFRRFLCKIEKLRDHIDFIEDPFPFNFQEWKVIQKEGWTLACDRQSLAAYQQAEAARILIFKPALQSLRDWKSNLSQIGIVTSYLGHPLGQLAAAYAASLVDSSGSFVHGLLSQHVYCLTPFSQSLNWNGPDFISPAGGGFGFENELHQLEWVNLNSEWIFG